MNDRQNATLNMMLTVSSLMQKNASKYADIPKIKAAVDDLASNITSIQEKNQERSGTKVQAATTEKQKEQELMINDATVAARIINVYASDTKNTSMQMQTNITKSQFYKLSHNEALGLAKNIFNYAQSNVQPLQEYGLEAEQTASLEIAIKNFETLIAKPRTVINERKGQTKSLAQLFAESKSLLYDRLDKLMSRYKTTDAGFYNTYFSSRNFINTSYRKDNTDKKSDTVK